MKYNLVNTSFNVTEHNISSYMAALNTMIINQTSLNDAHRLNVPTLIIRGTLDPFIVSKNLSRLSKENKNVTIKPIIAGHEIRGRYTKQLIEIITSDRQDKV